MSEYVFGRRPVIESLNAGKRSIHKIWIAAGSHGLEDVVQLAKERGIPTEFTRRDRLDRLVQGNHQGVVAQASAAEYLDLDGFLRQLSAESPCLVVALDEIQDPHNIGAILRSAGFFGVAAAIIPRWRSAPVGETAARVSSGAIEHVPMIRVRNLADAVNDLKEAGFEVVGADMEGESLQAYKPSKRTAIVFGSEGSGIRRLVKERCDKLLKIPGQGPVQSLNVSAAAAIFLYTLCTQRLPK